MAEKKNRAADFIGTCGIQAGLLALLTVCGYALFCLRAPLPTFVWTAEGAEVAGPVAGFFLWFSLLFVRYARQNEEDLALLKKRNLRDGERAFICGAIKPVGPLLRAPFSGKDCVGYSYRVTHKSDTGKATWTDYEGYALSPFVIRSPKGDIKPVPEASNDFFYELSQEKLGEAEDRAREYLRSTDFGSPKSGILGGSSRTKKIVGGPGEFRCDSAIGDPPQDLRGCRLEERIIQPGENVYAIGVYSSADTALFPDPDIPNKPFHLARGDAKVLAKKTRVRYIGAAVCNLVALAVAAVYFLLIVPGQG